MHRTCYLILAVAIACLFQSSAALADSADSAGSDRPNILWILAEDLSPWMGCYGDKTNQDHTPAIDQLAANGVLFKRTYMPAPVCSSCRSALITGVMQTTTGTQHHRSSRFTDGEIVPPKLRIELPKEVVTIPERLRKAGYFTFNSGKDDYNFHYNRREMYSVGSADDYQPGMNGWQGNRSRVNGSITEDTWNARPDKKQPWFGQIQIKGGKGSDRLVDKSNLLTATSLTPPPYFPDTKVYRTAWTKHYNSVRGADINVGQIIDQLRADGELDNTIVFFFSDHGNNESPRHKQFCYEGGVHVPLIIHGNHSLIANGTVRNDLVSGLDISATTLRLAGVELPEVIDGRDLFASDFSPRDHVISARDRCDYTIDRIRTVRTDRFRYIRNGFPDRSLMQPQYRDKKPIMKEMKQLKDAGKLSDYQLKHWFGQRPTEELYDIEADPHQMNSLADDPAFSEPLKQHRQLLDDWIAKTGDQGQKPESKTQLKATYEMWKDRKVFSDAKVNPEYDSFKNESPQPAQKDLGKLIFEDAFDRDESQEDKDEVGNNWTTNADKPWSKGKKQTDLRDGVLNVAPANGKRSDVLVIRKADLHDATIQFRFQLPNDDDQIGLVIADSKLKDVHAGHVMNVWMNKGQVKVSDMMNGFFEPKIYKRRKAGELTKDDKARIAAMAKSFPAPIETAKWHQVTITTRKDQLIVSIDDQVVGQFTAPAFAHHKNVLRVSFRRFGAMDDFKIYRRSPKADTELSK